MVQELENIEYNEIELFYNSLGKEKDLLAMRVDNILNSRYIIGNRDSINSINGIGGYWLSKGILPSLFIVVKEQYQQRGIGSSLLVQLIDHALKHYHILFLSTYNTIVYRHVIKMYKKHGFKHIPIPSKHYWMARYGY